MPFLAIKRILRMRQGRKIRLFITGRFYTLLFSKGLLFKMNWEGHELYCIDMPVWNGKTGDAPRPRIVQKGRKKISIIKGGAKETRIIFTSELVCAQVFRRIQISYLRRGCWIWTSNLPTRRSHSVNFTHWSIWTPKETPHRNIKASLSGKRLGLQWN